MVDPLSIGGLLLKVIGPVWRPLSGLFTRWNRRKDFETFKTFVLSVPRDRWWVVDTTWTPDMRGMAQDGVALKNLVQNDEVLITPDPAKPNVHTFVTGYRLKSDRFLFEDWLKVYRRRKQEEKDSYVKPSSAAPAPPSPSLPTPEQLAFGEFRRIVEAFPRDRHTVKNDAWPPAYVQVVDDAVELGCLAEEQIPDDLRKPTLENTRIGNRSMLTAYRRTDKAIVFEEWSALQRQKRGG